MFNKLYIIFINNHALLGSGRPPLVKASQKASVKLFRMYALMCQRHGIQMSHKEGIYHTFIFLSQNGTSFIYIYI